jgi:hypothetical protein
MGTTSLWDVINIDAPFAFNDTGHSGIIVHEVLHMMTSFKIDPVTEAKKNLPRSVFNQMSSLRSIFQT